MSREEILRAAMTLPREERIALSVQLLESLEPIEEGVEEAWRAEIERRETALERGEEQLVDAEDVLAEYGLRLDP
jgi:putative addiction module component (TIGR02574 family)